MIFTIVTEEILNNALSDNIIEMMGYSGNPTLRERALVCSELNDGNFAISVNLKAEGKRCAWTDLSSEEIELAEIMYGKDNLLMKEEYKNLDFKEITYE